MDAARQHLADQRSAGLPNLLEQAAQEVLVVTYWFDPAPRPEPYPVTVRFIGHRAEMRKLGVRDRFVRDERIAAAVPGSGPIAISARVSDINPGEWVVTASVIDPPPSARRASGRHEQRTEAPVVSPLPLDARLWHRWSPSVGTDARSAAPVSTSVELFARVVGHLPGAWAALVGLGMVVALVLQALVIAHDHLLVSRAWLITLAAIGVGCVGAKGWYIFLHRRDQGLARWNGWCIQGFITAATLAVAFLVLLRVPAGVLLDATAPGLMFGLAIGRVGCFLTGCCGGPPTASRWGVWCSDQRVGARRVPTQLLESALSLGLGLAALALVLALGPAGGAIFAATLAAYTWVRQGILRLRAEPRRTRLGGPIIATVAALALLGALVAIVR
jgi:phosphatidylglycerol:prolipoprotein diacylglycerol transferase